MTQKLSIFLALTMLLGIALWVPKSQAADPPILINEVQVSSYDQAGVEYPKHEFIELVNVSSSPVDLTGWQLQYLSSSNNGSGNPTSTLMTLSGVLPVNGQALYAHADYAPVSLVDGIFGNNDTSSSGLLAKSGGHIRLVNGANQIDCVAWGSAVNITGCDKAAGMAGADESLQRAFPDKSLGVNYIMPTTPQGGDLIKSPVAPTPVCENIEISEVLANPLGDDGAGEFIELYNPTAHIQPLFGCSLSLASNKKYAFEAEDSLLPQEYRAFYYSTTGLQLTNSGGTVSLTTSSQTLSTTYPNALDDQAWANVDGVWQITSQPTPNFANQASLQSTGPSTNSSALPKPVAPVVCPSSKYLNPDTNRCKNLPATTTNKPIICQKGYDRNPQTNRCRKIVQPAPVKPCPTGQSRNTQTNRCRKAVAATASFSQNGDKPSSVSYDYLIIGGVLTLVGGYGIYEYRREIFSLTDRFRGKSSDVV